MYCKICYVQRIKTNSAWRPLLQQHVFIHYKIILLDRSSATYTTVKYIFIIRHYFSSHQSVVCTIEVKPT